MCAEGSRRRSRAYVKCVSAQCRRRRPDGPRAPDRVSGPVGAGRVDARSRSALFGAGGEEARRVARQCAACPCEPGLRDDRVSVRLRVNVSALYVSHFFSRGHSISHSERT